MKDKKEIQIRVKISNDLDLAVKTIAEKKSSTMQDLINSIIKEYVLENIDIVLGGVGDKK